MASVCLIRARKVLGDPLRSYVKLASQQWKAPLDEGHPQGKAERWIDVVA